MCDGRVSVWQGETLGGAIGVASTLLLPGIRVSCGVIYKLLSVHTAKLITCLYNRGVFDCCTS